MSSAETSDDQRELGAWTIRTASEADIAAVLALWRRGGGPALTTDDEGALRTLLAHDPEALLVAEADDVWSAVGYTRQTERARFIRMLEEPC